MKIKIDDKSVTQDVKIGDVIKFPEKDEFYTVAFVSGGSGGYTLLPLSGRQLRAFSYVPSITALFHGQGEFYIFSKEVYEMKLSRIIGGE